MRWLSLFLAASTSIRGRIFVSVRIRAGSSSSCASFWLMWDVFEYTLNCLLLLPGICAPQVEDHWVMGLLHFKSLWDALRSWYLEAGTVGELRGKETSAVGGRCQATWLRTLVYVAVCEVQSHFVWVSNVSSHSVTWQYSLFECSFVSWHMKNLCVSQLNIMRLQMFNISWNSPINMHIGGCTLVSPDSATIICSRLSVNSLAHVDGPIRNASK
jgi:hypothetical protein